MLGVGKDIRTLKSSLVGFASSEFISRGGEFNGNSLLLIKNDRCADNFELCDAVRNKAALLA